MLFGKICTEVLQVVVDQEANCKELGMVQYRVRNFVFGMTCGCISSVNNSQRFLLDPPNQGTVKHEVHVINIKIQSLLHITHNASQLQRYLTVHSF